MNTFAELDRTEQVETLREAGRRLAIEPLMVEKDFWVCWVLAVVFGDRRLGDDIVFKGGTSLSTVYRAIARFSEDIDLGVTPARLGFDEAELNDAPSATKRRNTSRALLEACTKFVETEMRDHLLADMRKRPGGAELGAASLAYEFDNAIHSPNLLFTYPTALGAEGSYVRKVIKLEFGSLTNQRPKGVHTATSLLERALPGAHADARATVVALELERTFWEKATILHSEAHRPAEKALRDRTARHYSDFAALWRHDGRAVALARLDLLADVAAHKQRFFGTGWANYSSARPGTLRLSPPDARLPEIRNDYEKMRGMFFEQPATFEEMLAVLAEAERTINSLATP